MKFKSLDSNKIINHAKLFIQTLGKMTLTKILQFLADDLGVGYETK